MAQSDFNSCLCGVLHIPPFNYSRFRCRLSVSSCISICDYYRGNLFLNYSFWQLKPPNHLCWVTVIYESQFHSNRYYSSNRVKQPYHPNISLVSDTVLTQKKKSSIAHNHIKYSWREWIDHDFTDSCDMSFYPALLSANCWKLTNYVKVESSTK